MAGGRIGHVQVAADVPHVEGDERDSEFMPKADDRARGLERVRDEAARGRLERAVEDIDGPGRVGGTALAMPRS
jgi:hypothetical protein